MSFTTMHSKKRNAQREYTIICKLHGQQNCLAAKLYGRAPGKEMRQRNS